MTPPRKTMPGGVPTQLMGNDLTPVGPEETPTPLVGSRSFIAVISTIVGILVSTTVVVGFLGRYFYVDRAEYAERVLKESDERGKLQGILGRFEVTLGQQATTLERQEKAFDRMSDAVRAIELRQASGRR